MIKDNGMIYDDLVKRYRLSSEFVNDEMGIDLNAILFDEFETNPVKLQERTLKYTRDMVYDYMRMNCADYSYACELIENNMNLFLLFRDVLRYQLIFFIQNGDSGISVDGDINNTISKRSLQILKSNGLLSVQRRLTNRCIRGYGCGCGCDCYDGGGIY